jgi:hypothetical protein
MQGEIYLTVFKNLNSWKLEEGSKENWEGLTLLWGVMPKANHLMSKKAKISWGLAKSSLASLFLSQIARLRSFK